MDSQKRLSDKQLKLFLSHPGLWQILVRLNHVLEMIKEIIGTDDHGEKEKEIHLAWH